jgi:hypothetical protein
MGEKNQYSNIDGIVESPKAVFATPDLIRGKQSRIF